MTQQETQAAHAGASQRRRFGWHWLYYLLAAFNVATIGMGLAVTHLMLNRHQRSLEISRTWSGRMSDYTRLRDLAALVDAPAQDVFDDLDVSGARIRSRYAQDIFARRLAELRAQVNSTQDSDSKTIIADLDAVGSEMQALVDEQKIVYDDLSSGKSVLAAARKESLTRHDNRVNFAIAALRDDAARIENSTLEREISTSKALQRIEWTGTALISLLVIVTTSYGHLLFRRVQKNSLERARLHQALKEELERRQAIQEQLEHAHDELEEQVERRTVQLSATNAELVQQIQDRLHAEETLRLSEERHRELFENASDVIFTTGHDGVLTSLNHAGRELFGIDPEQDRVSLLDLLTPPCRSSVEQALEASASARLTQLQLLDKNGRSLKFEASISPIVHNSHVVGLQAVARNVTDRERVEEQLRQSQKMEAVGRLAGGVAHDFNNLLNVITGYSELISIQPNLTPTVMQHATEINKTAKRAAALTRQLLTFSRKQSSTPMVVNLNGILSDSMKMLRRLIESQIEITMQLSPDLGNVRADAGQVEQVLMNLALNARDAMPDGGKLVVRTTNFDWQHTGDLELDAAIPAGPHVVLEVSDTGVGMSEEVKARMFDPFFTTKGVGKGTGLGLSIVYGIVKQAGGHISVYSEPGKGTTCRIYLPRVDAALEDTRGVQPVQMAPAQHQTVLLVEDEEALRRMTGYFLSQLGYQVLEAADGAQAIEVASQHHGKIQLIVTDVMMPGVDGFELYKELSKERKEAKFLFMSGYADDVIAAHEDWDGEAPFIQKPFGLADLDAKLKELCMN